jgi:hypothetical protein
MAITGVDSLITNLITYPQVIGKQGGLTAAAAGTPHTPWYASGIIGAGSAPTGGLNGATFTAPVNGAIAVPSAVTGETTRLAGVDMTQVGGVGAVWIVDRLWGNVPVVTTTTAQAITSPTWPARDASASTAGAGVLFALECSSATGNGSPITNTTISYTNSAGTSGHTGAVPSFPATAPQGTFVPLSLSAGDIGGRSVQSITLGTSYVSGQVHLIAYRLIASIPVPTANIPTLLNYLQLRLPAVWDSSVLQLVYWPTGTSISAVQGSLTYAQG